MNINDDCKCCGSCAHNEYEDSLGNGYCMVKETMTRCNNSCDEWTPFIIESNNSNH